MTKVLPNASPCARHTVNRNNTKMSACGAEKGLLQGCARKQVAHALKTPKGEGGAWLIVENFSVSDPLFLRSGPGQGTTFL